MGYWKGRPDRDAYLYIVVNAVDQNLLIHELPVDLIDLSCSAAERETGSNQRYASPRRFLHFVHLDPLEPDEIRVPRRG